MATPPPLPTVALAQVQGQARAEARQRTQLEKLYELSRRILFVDRRQTIGPQIVPLIQEIFGTESVALFDATAARMDTTGSGANELEQLARNAYFQDSTLVEHMLNEYITYCFSCSTGSPSWAAAVAAA